MPDLASRGVHEPEREPALSTLAGRPSEEVRAAEEVVVLGDNYLLSASYIIRKLRIFVISLTTTCHSAKTLLKY